MIHVQAARPADVKIAGWSAQSAHQLAVLQHAKHAAPLARRVTRMRARVRAPLLCNRNATSAGKASMVVRAAPLHSRRCCRYAARFARRKRSDSYTIKIQRGVWKVARARGGQRRSVSLESIRYSIQSTPSLPLPYSPRRRASFASGYFPSPSCPRLQASDATVLAGHEIHRR